MAKIPDEIAPRKLGRPEHVPTPENRENVGILLALGWNHDRIANGIGINAETLRKHYSGELAARATARDSLRSKIMMKFWEQFEAGNVAAGKAFVAMVEKNDVNVSGHAAFVSAQRPVGESKPQRLGKKEIAAQEARTAGEGSDWGDDLKPPIN